MSLTRDARTIQTILLYSNSLYSSSILFGQAYNLNKNKFSTLQKDLGLFQSLHLEGLLLCNKLPQE